MNNENEIERMANIIHETNLSHCPNTGRNYCDKRVGITCKSCKQATNLSAQGIGDKKQAVKEFAEKLKGFIIGNTCVSDDDVNSIYHEIDNLITELYGAEE